LVGVFGIFFIFIADMNIGIDMMGGDFAPLEAVKGAKEYLEKNSANDVVLVFFGDESALQSILAQHSIPEGRYNIVPTTQEIDMHEHPTKALKEKTNSSIAVGFQFLATGRIDAFVSAGNTGAMLIGALFSIKAIDGVLRPTISSVIPKLDGTTGLLVDVGLNADCKPEQLNQFAVMGSVFSKYIFGIDDPKVGLINVGEEEGKGNLLAQATYPLLKDNKAIHFIGNVEGRDLFNEKANVMVCEGFTGNVILKMAESIFDIATEQKIENPYLNRFNFEIYGGTPVLGVEKPVIIGHGISHATAFSNMVDVAVRMINTNVLDKVKEAMANI